ncbi:ABC transporter permease [Paenibacillus sp. MAHUQ-46]|uniref:ABC transporter permease n=2 Tax=Paenibacillus TaxID=44249 RepID=A0A934MQ95_9BACL|nr:ABC transporter permease [Paenibacillus roseus]MBJ6361643.1 ABC transporter permease [Paenibacillus roseus]
MLKLFRGSNDILGVFLILFGLCVVMTFASDNFLTVDNLSSVARAFSFVAIMAIGMTIVIITGGIDMSVGSIFAFAGVITAYSYSNLQLALPLCILLGVIGGAIFGFINGLLINECNLPPFIATLGTMSVARGLSYAITSGFPISMPSSFNQLGQGMIFNIPYPIILMIVLAIIFTFVLNKMIFGRHVYAVGGSEEASAISGIKVKRVKLAVYSISGFLSAIAGIIMTARLGVAQSTAGLGYELDVIAAVIIGGASFSGGKGTIVGAILGAAIMGVLRNGLVLLNVSAYWQQTVIGLVIIIAVTIDQLRYKKKA